jgi:hypothetical protein
MFSENGDSPTLDDVRDILERNNKRPILLYVGKGEKHPSYRDWQKVSEILSKVVYWEQAHPR